MNKRGNTQHYWGLSDDIIQQVRKDNCFDFLRYFFSISLIIAHFCTITVPPHQWFITGGMSVRAFFTMAGFLVPYSFLRRGGDLRSYTRQRFCRIVPAYIACIIFCFLVGWGITTMTTSAFFASPQTWKYLLSNMAMLNWLEPELPHTFQTHSVPVMNASLWTMKQEVLFYFLVPILLWCMRKGAARKLLCLFFLTGCVVLYNFVNVQTQYFMYFLSGQILLLHFDVFSKWVKTLLPIAILLHIPLYTAHALPYITPLCHALQPICFPIALIGLAYIMKPLNVFRKLPNITYGLYLYHFPVIQVLIHYGIVDYSIGISLLLAFLITGILATLSWFLIEKPLTRTSNS